MGTWAGTSTHAHANSAKMMLCEQVQKEKEPRTAETQMGASRLHGWSQHCQGAGTSPSPRLRASMTGEACCSSFWTGLLPWLAIWACFITQGSLKGHALLSHCCDQIPDEKHHKGRRIYQGKTQSITEGKDPRVCLSAAMIKH